MRLGALSNELAKSHTALMRATPTGDAAPSHAEAVHVMGIQRAGNKPAALGRMPAAAAAAAQDEKEAAADKKMGEASRRAMRRSRRRR